MSIARSYLLVSVIGCIFFLAIGSVDSAYAVDFVLSDAASCTGLPGGGEMWAGTTCTKSGNLNLPVGDTLTISPGITLAFTNNFDLRNDGSITNNGIISIVGTSSNDGRIFNRNTADFTNSGTITITGTSDDSGRLLNQDDATFTNSGTITITGFTEQSGWILNEGSSTLTNSGSITITGTSLNSGQLRNLDAASITNSGTISLMGVNAGISDVSALVINLSVLTNSGSLTSNFKFDNKNANSEITNSGTIQITFALDNTGGFIFNDCSEITFGSIYSH